MLVSEPYYAPGKKAKKKKSKEARGAASATRVLQTQCPEKLMPSPLTRATTTMRRRRKKKIPPQGKKEGGL